MSLDTAWVQGLRMEERHHYTALVKRCMTKPSKMPSIPIQMKVLLLVIIKRVRRLANGRAEIWFTVSPILNTVPFLGWCSPSGTHKDA